MTSHDAPARVDGDLAGILDAYRTCELLTVTRTGLPIAWPTVNIRRPDGTFLVTSSIALPQKAFNVRRDPRVGMLFSDPTASGLDTPPHVLVQGQATCPDEIITSPAAAEDFWRRLYERQPISRGYSRTAIGRRLFDWYYMRLFLTITPAAVRTRQPALDLHERLATPAEARRAGDDPFGLALRRMPGFTSAVLAAFSDAGEPTLVRLRPRADLARRKFVVPVPDGHALRNGPASLLCHSHDESLWTLRSFVVAGQLAHDGEDWILTPTRYIPGGDRMGPVSAVRSIRDLRRTAQAYLDRRGRERPRIPWQEYKPLTATSRRDQPPSGRPQQLRS